MKELFWFVAIVVAISWVAGEEGKPIIEQLPVLSPTRDVDVKAFQAPVPARPSPHVATNLRGLENGEFECIVTNQSRSESPFDSSCEKEEDEITIHFSDGRYIVTDTDGLQASSGDYWSIEVDK